MHMITGSRGENRVSDILRDFKKFTSKEIIRAMLVESTESRRDWMLNRFEYAGKNEKKLKITYSGRKGMMLMRFF